MKIIQKDKLNLKIDPKHSALLVIDMQRAFLDKGSPAEIPMGRKILPTLNKVISFCRQRTIPIIFTRISHERLGGVYKELFPDHFKDDGTPVLTRDSKGFRISNEIDLKNGDMIVDKDYYSPFYGTDLEIILRNFGITTLIIAGQATNVCCESAARDAFFRDLRVIFLSDANATLNVKMHKATLETVSLCLGYVVSSLELFRVIRRSE